MTVYWCDACRDPALGDARLTDAGPCRYDDRGATEPREGFSPPCPHGWAPTNWEALW